MSDFKKPSIEEHVMGEVNHLKDAIAIGDRVAAKRAYYTTILFGALIATSDLPGLDGAKVAINSADVFETLEKGRVYVGVPDPTSEDLARARLRSLIYKVSKLSGLGDAA